MNILQSIELKKKRIKSNIKSLTKLLDRKVNVNFREVSRKEHVRTAYNKIVVKSIIDFNKERLKRIDE